MAKKVIANISIESSTRDFLKEYADKKQMSVSKVIKDLVDKYLISEGEVIPVILKIPLKLKGDQENLKKWLETRVISIVNALSK